MTDEDSSSSKPDGFRNKLLTKKPFLPISIAKSGPHLKAKHKKGTKEPSMCAVHPESKQKELLSPFCRIKKGISASISRWDFWEVPAVPSPGPRIHEPGGCAGAAPYPDLNKSFNGMHPPLSLLDLICVFSKMDFGNEYAEREREWTAVAKKVGFVHEMSFFFFEGIRYIFFSFGESKQSS